MEKLPDYVAIKSLHEHIPVLRTPAKEMSFPLSDEDKEILRLLEAKFDAEENCAGLAAPQIGFGKKAFVFAVSDDEQLKKWRTDLTDTMPKSLWINPSYEANGPELTTDMEGCFSVDNLAGPVIRYHSIRYKAFLPDGTEINGIANGFLARVIQHETDHLNGRLCIDLVKEDQIIKVDEYRKMRAEAMAAEEESGS